MFDQDQRLQPSGLEGVAEKLGVEFGRDMVLERDPELTAPSGQGETFQASPLVHEITQAMAKSRRCECS